MKLIDSPDDDYANFVFNTPPNVPTAVVSYFESGNGILGEALQRPLIEADHMAGYIALRAIGLGCPGDFTGEPELGARLWVLTDTKIGGKSKILSPCPQDDEHAQSKAIRHYTYNEGYTYDEARKLYRKTLKREKTTLCIGACAANGNTNEAYAYGLVLRTEHRLPHEDGNITCHTDEIPSSLIFNPKLTDLDIARKQLYDLLTTTADNLGVDMGAYLPSSDTAPVPDSTPSARPIVDISRSYTGQDFGKPKFQTAADVLAELAATAPTHHNILVQATANTDTPAPAPTPTPTAWEFVARHPLRALVQMLNNDTIGDEA